MMIQRPNRLPHDCASCIYLGSALIKLDEQESDSWTMVDWYSCGQGGLYTTILGRWGHEPREYWSSGGLKPHKAENNLFPAGTLTRMQEYFNMIAGVGT